MDQVSREMPRYKCHKEVYALKIAAVDASEAVTGSVTIVPADEGYGAFTVTAEWFERHRPEVGGYFVAYGDGYTSYSPGDVFESGYERI